MERIISYDELPYSRGQSIYLRMETDPKLYLNLLSKGYRIVNNIVDAEDDTIYVTGRRQDYTHRTFEEYKDSVDKRVEEVLSEGNITKPKTVLFSYEDLINRKYKIPFVLKNENQNGGREKFLIQTEEDYENLILACNFLLDRDYLILKHYQDDDIRFHIDYDKYLDVNFSVQEYVKTPSEYNTTLRLLTTTSDDLLYAALKYKKPVKTMDDTTLLGYLLHEVYPLSTKSIVSNTLSGGSNILLGEGAYPDFEHELLQKHDIESDQFHNVVEQSKKAHKAVHSELGVLCGFDYIYDKEQEKWYLLEYHSRPMVGDYSKRQGIPYSTNSDRVAADGRVRATALSLQLKKTR